MAELDLFPAGETLRAVVRKHGGDPQCAYAFDEDVVELLPYATLRDQRASHPDLFGPIIGIYVWQDTPLMLLVDGDRLANRKQLAAIRRVTALRGDIPYLGVAAGGRLDIHTVGLSKGAGTKVDLAKLRVEVLSTIPYIASVRPALMPNAATVSKVVLSLLDAALRKLVECGLSELEAISLAGRALFARFLADRDLPIGEHISGRSDEAFANPTLARQTCEWLDRTFNGNLLPLDYDQFGDLPDAAFGILVDIMRRAPNGQMSLGWEEKWDNLHFAHIPVGVLSQVYEQYLKAHEPARRKKEGSYYTPAIIADLMVRATLEGIDSESRSKARVLDPAAGAGVFLITAFRHLVAQRWQRDGIRPNTKVLREILYRQITGFDINEAALRFAALGLYLVSIELDPEPEPVSKLSFDDLRGSVLHKPEVKGAENEGFAALGSLGPGVSDEHVHRYDIVIGNPPWKTGAAPSGWSYVKKQVRAIAAERCESAKYDEPDDPYEDDFPYEAEAPSSKAGSRSRTSKTWSGIFGPEGAGSLLPNKALDLPFVWLASRWARPEGQVAFALHGRLLFQQSEGMPEARAALLTAFDVTSVINGALLRKTKVWPQITAPFCILFAKNRSAQRGMAFRFITPREEPRLNRVGIFRLDAANAPMVRTLDIVRDPIRLKTLMRASELDLEIRQRIVSEGHPTLLGYIESFGGVSGVGIQPLRSSSRFRKDKDLPGADASYLKGRPYLRAGAPEPEIDTEKLPTFAADRIHDPRSPSIFTGPLLIVDQSVRAKPSGVAAGVSHGDLIYSESHYGYGLAALGVARGLSLAFLLRSSFARWWFLITSGKYGFEREVVEKATVDKIPVPSVWMQDGTANDLFPPGWLLAGAKHHQDDLDEIVARAYGLEENDLRIIKDTLCYAFPPKKSDKLSAPTMDSFLEGLEFELHPWEAELGITLEADLADIGLAPAWRFVTVGQTRGSGDLPVPPDHLLGFLNAADESGSTEIYHPGKDGRLWIGQLAQPRYWTFSQGIRTARHVIWNYIDFLSGRSDGVELH